MKKSFFVLLTVFLLTACSLQANLQETKDKVVDKADQAKADLIEAKNTVEGKVNEVNDKINKINEAGEAIGDIFDDEDASGQNTEESAQ